MSRRIFLYIAAIFISNFGNSISFLACGKASFDRFHIVAVFGAIILLEHFKGYLMSATSTRFVDHYGGKKVAIAVDLFLAAVTLSAGLLEARESWQYTPLVVMLLINLCKPIYSNAIFVLKGEMTNSDAFFKVNSWGASAQQAGMFLGLSFAAVVILKLPLAVVFGVDSATYLGSAIFTLFIKTIPDNIKLTKTSFWSKFNLRSINLELLQLSVQHPVLLLAVLAFAFQVISLSAYNMLLFKVVDERFGGSSSWLATFELIYAAAVSLFSFLIGAYGSKNLGKYLRPMIGVQALVFVGFAIAGNSFIFAGLVIIYALCSCVVFPATITVMQSHSEVASMARIGAFRGASQALLSIPILLIASILADRVSSTGSIYFVACSGFLVFLSLKRWSCT